jgi:hypothetical protein
VGRHARPEALVSPQCPLRHLSIDLKGGLSIAQDLSSGGSGFRVPAGRSTDPGSSIKAATASLNPTFRITIHKSPAPFPFGRQGEQLNRASSSNEKASRVDVNHDACPWARSLALPARCQDSVSLIWPSCISYKFSIVTAAITAYPRAFVMNGLSDVRPCARQRHADGEHRIASVEHQGLSTLRTGFRVSVSETMTRSHERVRWLQDFPTCHRQILWQARLHEKRRAPFPIRPFARARQTIARRFEPERSQ